MPPDFPILDGGYALFSARWVNVENLWRTDGVPLNVRESAQAVITQESPSAARLSVCIHTSADSHT